MNCRVSIFNSGILLALAAATLARADDIMLKGDNRLSGELRSLNPAGIMELISPLTTSPLMVKADAVEKVIFSTVNAAPSLKTTLLELANGDVLPTTIDRLDEQSLTVTTADAGQLVIPRTALKALQFGVHPRKVLFSGPTSLEEWTDGTSHSGAWRFEDNSLLINGVGQASRKVQRAQQFVLKFSLQWETDPNFQVNFFDEDKPSDEPADRYSLKFSGGKIEVIREAKLGNRSTTLILSNRTAADFADKSIEFEIRVDRKNSHITLMMNQELVGEGIDPLPNLPQGEVLTFISNAAESADQTLSSIVLADGDEASDQPHAEPLDHQDSDRLISRDEDCWSGRFTGFRKMGDELVLLFQCDSQEKPLELLESEVSAIFFATGPAAAQVPIESPFALRLRENGLLRVSACTFTVDNVAAVHPSLGAISIRRAGVSALERVEKIVQKEPQE
jgi:hypothetical protein